jgi:hypothetical protein
VRCKWSPRKEQLIGNVSFTPDGGFIDYTTSSVAGADGTLYQVPVLGGAPRLLLDKVDTAVSFSPDATQMAYAMQDVQTSKINVMVCKGGWQLAAQVERLCRFHGHRKLCCRLVS